MGVVVTLTIWTSKLPGTDAMQPAGAELEGEMADVTASGLGLARAEAARARKVMAVFMVCFDGSMCEECGTIIYSRCEMEQTVVEMECASDSDRMAMSEREEVYELVEDGG